MKDLWDKFKGKLAVGGLALLLGVPAVGAGLGVKVTTKEQNKVCIEIVEQK